jgi:electron transfer flavoprotein alpha/beta subunit
MAELNIIVPVKQVPETGKARMDEETGTIKREGVESIINPLDLYGVEAALRLKETLGATVTTLSMGPPAAEKALRETIAMGCDRAVLICGREFAGSDTWATSYALAQGVRKIGAFDLIICGERATDGDTGQVGPAMAAFLDVPPITYVSRIEEVADGRIRVQRLVENGYEVLSCPLPCMLTVVKEISDPRLPTLHGKRTARSAAVPAYNADAIGADQSKLGLNGSPTRVVRITRPKITREGEKISVKKEEELAPAVDRIVEFIDARLPDARLPTGGTDG